MWLFIIWAILLVLLLLLPLSWGWGYRGWGWPRPYYLNGRRRADYTREDVTGWGVLADLLWIVALALLVLIVLAVVL